jgi:hypothetical protein
MNCDEFRRLYNLWLDMRMRGPLPPGADLHRRDCPVCAHYARAMLRLEGQLQRLREIPFPEEILSRGGEAGEDASPGGAGMADMLRTVALLAVPPLLVWSLGMLLVAPWNFAIRFLLVAGAMAACAFESLRVRFVS